MITYAINYSYDVDYSYGSPDIGNDYVECHIGEEGYVFSDVWVFTEDSYGNKTPSTVMVLGAYVKKRRDIY